MGHFFPSYTFDLDHTLYFFTSGRYEYRNKGMDLFIEALHRLNQRLQGSVADRADGRRVHHHARATRQHQRRRAAEPVDVRRAAQHLHRDRRSRWAARLFHAAATGRLPTYRGAAAGRLAGAAEARDARLAQPAASR